MAILGIFGAFGLGGMLVIALFAGKAAKNPVGNVVIWGTFDETAITTVIRGLAENDSRFSQVAYVQKDSPTYEEDLTKALAEGTGPDIFFMTQDFALYDAPKVYPVPYGSITKEQFSSTFVQAANPFLGDEGVVAMPLFADPLLMYWNPDMVATAGSVNPPAYWDEMTSFAEKISKRESSGGLTRFAVALGEYRNVEHAKDLIALLIYQAGGAITGRDNTGRLIPQLSIASSGAVGRPTESALVFYTQFSDPSKNFYSWTRGQRSAKAAFAAGDLALYFGYAGEAPEITTMNPNLNIAKAVVPQIRGKNPQSFARVYGLAIARNGKNPSGAAQVIPLLVDHAVSKKLSEAVGVPSARRDVLQEVAQSGGALTGNRGLCGDTDVVTCSVGLSRAWVDPNPTKTDEMFRDIIEGVTAGSTRIVDALSRGDQTLALLIK